MSTPNLPNLYNQAQASKIQNLSFGPLSLHLLDGELTKSTLLAVLQILKQQNEKIDELEKIQNDDENSKIGDFKRQLVQHESMISNLAHNAFGYVDPDDVEFGKGKKQRKDTTTSLSPKNADSVNLPSNFLLGDQKRSRPLPLSIRKTRGLSMTFGNESDTEDSDNQSEVNDDEEEEKKEDKKEQQYQQSPLSICPPLPKPASPPRMSLPVAISPSNKSDSAKNRFLKAKQMITFTANLKRTSMLKSRAPSEFSLLERVSKLESELITANTTIDEMGSNFEMRVGEVGKKDREWALKSLQALGKRIFEVEVNQENSSSHSDANGNPSESHLTGGVINNLQLEIKAHIDKITSQNESIMDAKMLTLQQRCQETSNSYNQLSLQLSSLAADASKNTVSSNFGETDEYKSLKLLQFHNKAQLLRHRLTHLDSEHMIEKHNYYHLKSERQYSPKSDNDASNIYNEVGASLNNCVLENKKLWETFSNIDNSASIAWVNLRKMIEKVKDDVGYQGEELEVLGGRIDDVLDEIDSFDSFGRDRDDDEGYDRIVSEIAAVGEGVASAPSASTSPSPTTTTSNPSNVADQPPPVLATLEPAIPSPSAEPHLTVSVLALTKLAITPTVRQIQSPRRRPSKIARQASYINNGNKEEMNERIESIVVKAIDTHIEKMSDSLLGSNQNDSTSITTLDQKLTTTSNMVVNIVNEMKDTREELNEKASIDDVENMYQETSVRLTRMIEGSVEDKADREDIINLENFVQKCRMEVIKLRNLQIEANAGLRRLIDKKVKLASSEAEDREGENGVFGLPPSVSMSSPGLSSSAKAERTLVGRGRGPPVSVSSKPANARSVALSKMKVDTTAAGKRDAQAQAQAQAREDIDREELEEEEWKNMIVKPLAQTQQQALAQQQPQRPTIVKAPSFKPSPSNQTKKALLVPPPPESKLGGILWGDKCPPWKEYVDIVNAEV